jgi:opacity protein-like surface antigen
MTIASRVKQQLVCATALMVACLGAAHQAHAQDEPRGYVGAVVGIATLSADATTSTEGGHAAVALYKPENGPALNVFAGVHVHRYFSVQANYIWNRNDLTVFSSVASPEASGFSEQPRKSAQHAVVGDALVYFRPRGDSIRPYLSAGLALVRFASEGGQGVGTGLPAPDSDTSSTRVALRVAVGIDFAIAESWSFRYSFSETISRNPISRPLTPPGERGLANFQNLFGFVRRF